MLLQRPREPRRLTVVKARMHDGRREADVVIGNVSSRGLMAKCDRPPPKGARVEIRHGALRIAGEVTWSRNRRFGLHSEEPIDLSALFPVEARSVPRSPQRFTPPKTRLVPPAPISRPEASAWKSPSDPIVAILVAVVTTTAVETGLLNFAAAWAVVLKFVPG